MLLDIPPWPNPMPPISLYCDSEASLKEAYKGTYNGKSRHIGLRHDYEKGLIREGTVTIAFVRSIKNLADPLTKPLTRDLIISTTRDMGLRPLISPVTDGNTTSSLDYPLLRDSMLKRSHRNRCELLSHLSSICG